MPIDATEFTVFVASPSDVPDERAAVKRAAERCNQTVSPTTSARVRVVGWEQVGPDLGRPQSLINPLVDECDVFIGLLNRRWGSATGTHSSGFEEEYERARSRRVEADRPHIGIFFKDVPAESVSDPGPELAKVLLFKEKLGRAHEALYGVFESIDELEYRLAQFFTEYVLKEAAKTASATPKGTSRDQAELPAVNDSHSNPALRQIGPSITALSEIISYAHTDRSMDRDRLLLFMLSINQDPQILPTHVANRLYRNEDLYLTGAESVLWFRSLLRDVASSPLEAWDRVIPGWRLFISDSSEATPVQDVLVEHLLDEDRLVARGALYLLIKGRLRPERLWQDVQLASPDAEPSTRASSMELWVRLFSAAHMRPELLNYIALTLCPKDHQMFDALVAELVDTDQQGSLLSLLSYATGDPLPLCQEVADEFAIAAWQEDKILVVLDDLPTHMLARLVTGRHRSTRLRGSALSSLIRKRQVTKDVVSRAFGERVEVARESMIRELFEHRSELSADALSALPEIVDDDKSSYEAKQYVIAFISSRSDLEDMKSQSIRGVDAWCALAWRNEPGLLEQAREVLDTDVSRLSQAWEDLESLPAGPSLVRYLKIKARSAALELLIREAPSDADPLDRDRAYAEFQRNDVLTTSVAARALAKFGRREDYTLLLNVADKIYDAGLLEQVVTRAVQLGGVDVARMLVLGEDPERAATAVSIMDRLPGIKDGELINLLYNQHPKVRLLALQVLKGRLDNAKLQHLLKTYHQRIDGYFYNVVTELDFLLYGPRALSTQAASPSDVDAKTL